MEGPGRPGYVGIANQCSEPQEYDHNFAVRSDNMFIFVGKDLCTWMSVLQTNAQKHRNRSLILILLVLSISITLNKGMVAFQGPMKIFHEK